MTMRFQLFNLRNRDCHKISKKAIFSKKKQKQAKSKTSTKNLIFKTQLSAELKMSKNPIKTIAKVHFQLLNYQVL